MAKLSGPRPSEKNPHKFKSSSPQLTYLKSRGLSSTRPFPQKFPKAPATEKATNANSCSGSRASRGRRYPRYQACFHASQCVWLFQNLPILVILQIKTIKTRKRQKGLQATAVGCSRCSVVDCAGPSDTIREG